MLQRFDGENGIELVINTDTGESFASLAGYSRMSGVEYSTIRKRAERLRDSKPLETAEMQTSSGFRTVTLLNEDTIADWIVSDNPQMARMMLKAGIRVFNHTLAGFNVKSTIELEVEHFLEFFKQFLLDTMKMSNNMTVEQRLRFFDIFDNFNNKILQYSKVGMMGMAQLLANIIGVSNIYDDNMRLSVQVQKEYRESTEAKVMICEPISEYIIKRPKRGSFKDLNEAIEIYFTKKKGNYEFTGNVNDQIDITELITDVLALYNPNARINDCKRKIELFIKRTNLIPYHEAICLLKSEGLLDWNTRKAYGFRLRK